MSLFDRVTTLLKADAHGVVDSLEDRRLVLRQCLREAEVELAAKKARREALAAEGTGLDRERERLDAAVRALDADVELALDRAEERLARHSARRLLEARREAAAIAARLAEIGREAASLDERLEAQEGELAALRTRVRAVLAEPESPDGPSSCTVVAEEDVEMELLRRRGERKGGA